MHAKYENMTKVEMIQVIFCKIPVVNVNIVLGKKSTLEMLRSKVLTELKLTLLGKHI